MKKGGISGIILFFVLNILFITANQAWAYSGGTGTEADPFQITTSADLVAIGLNPLDWDKHFILTADIDMSYYDGSTTERTYNPIGNDEDHTFTGKFDGNDHTISNLTINKPNNNYLGLFAYIGNGAEVSNIDMDTFHITGDCFLGGLCGWNYGIISDCIVNGIINGHGHTGVLCGINYGVLNNCESTAAISISAINGSGALGGLCGGNVNGTINSCYATGTVTAVDSGNAGGLCGYTSDGSIINSYASGNVTGNSSNVGGLCGYSDFGTIRDSHASGNVTGNMCVGGLCGEMYSSTISDSYATGDVNGQSYVGGLCGHSYSWGTITNCYARGNVNGNDKIGGFCGHNAKYDSALRIENCYSSGSVSATATIDVGNFLGFNEGTAVACFYDNQKVTLTRGVGFNNGGTVNVTGKTTAEMKSSTTYTLAGWDFNAIWDIDEGVSYPYFLVIPELGVSLDTGTVDFIVGTGQSINCTVTNSGTGAVSSPFTIRLYYHTSSDPGWDTLNSSWRLAEVMVNPPLEAGESTVVSVPFTAPANGMYYFRAIVDQADAIDEQNETNNWSGINNIFCYTLDAYEPDNTAAQAVPITDIISHRSLSHNDADWFVFTVTEQSSVQVQAIGNYCWKMYLYNSDATTQRDYRGGWYDNPTIQIVLEPGNYYVKLEPYDSNVYNIYDYTLNISQSPVLADVAVSATQSGTLYFSVPDPLWVIKARCYNQGGLDIPGGTGVDFKVYYSANNSVDWNTLGADAVVGTYHYSLPLAAGGQSDEFSIPLSILAGINSGYLRIKTDPDNLIAESDENDNWAEVKYFETYTSDIYEPDDDSAHAKVLPTDGTVQTHSINPEIDQDWFKFTLTETRSVTVRVENAGGDMRLYLYDQSLNQLLFNYFSNNGQIKINLMAGTYYLMTREYYGNYVIAGYDIRIMTEDVLPDLTVRNSSSSHISTTAGQTVAIPVDFKNIGNTASENFDAKMYISADPECDWNALPPAAVVATTTVSGISAGGATNHGFSIAVPATAGVYFYRVRTDTANAVAELKEDNNWSPVIIVAANSKYTYGGGSGTIDDPYLISTAFQMNAIGAISADWNSYFKLTTDIDLAEYSEDQYNIIGNSSINFTGTFDGDNHTITNFNWEKDQSYVGLWGYMHGTVKNLKLINVNINSGYSYVGAIAGYIYYGNIINCHINGKIEGDEYVGGIAGRVYYGQLSSCSAEGYVNGRFSGGIAGFIESNSTLLYCTSMAVISGRDYIGGITGYIGYNNTINTCFAYGDVSGEYDYIGGLVGFTDNYDWGQVNIRWSGAYGNVTGHNYVGGLVGYANQWMTINACFATGNVTSTGEYAGGLIGYNRGAVNNCYARGQVNGVHSVGGLAGMNDETGQMNNCVNSGQIIATGNNHGGVVGYNKGGIDNSFWDTQTSGYATAVGFFYSGSVDADGLTTDQLKTQAVYTAKGWDFNTVWRIDEGTGYPYHYTAPDLTIASAAAGGTQYVACGGTTEIPFVVSNTGNGAVSGVTFTARLYRSPNPNGSSPTLVDELLIDDIALGGQVAGNFIYTSGSSTDATYYLKLAVDEANAIQEKDETNNQASLMMMIEYRPDAYEPDNTRQQAKILPMDGTVQTHDICPPTDVDWYMFDLTENSTVTIQFGSENNSWWNGKWTVYDSAETSIYNDYVSNSTIRSLDLAAGHYYLKLQAPENYTDYVIKGYTIKLTAVPFQAELSSNAQFTTSGNDCLRITSPSAPVNLSVNIYNSGKLDAGGFMNRIYLSSVPEINAGSQLLAEVPLAGLAVGQTNTTNILIPITASGVYYVIADVDSNNDIVEWNENNRRIVGILAVDYNYSGGDGSQTTPYQIASPEELYNLSRLKVDWDKNFIVTADIDMAGFDGQSGPAFNPIGLDNDDESFRGTFDGQSHVISNLTMNGSDPDYYELALFGHVTTGAIRNLGLMNARITAGENTEKIGTLVAWCGQQEGVMVENCYATGEIVVGSGNSSDDYVGGLIARVNRNSIVENCYTLVHITAANMNNNYEDSIGGLIGWNNGTVRQCYSRSTIDVSDYSEGCIGGLIGLAQRYSTIMDCYSIGNMNVLINADAELYDENIRSIGGFLGWNGDWDGGETAFIGNCYHAGRISTNRTDFVGGFCGHGFGTVQSCFWDSEIAGVPMDYSNTTGLPTANMKTKDIYLNASWLFAENGGPWIMADGLSYPVLSDLYHFDGGSGTVADPYQVRTPMSLVAAGEKPDKHFNLKADVDLAGYVVDKPIIGDFNGRPFTGTFDGGGHVIRNFNLNLPQEDHCGLFGCISGAGAAVRNLGLEGVYVEAPTISFVGGLVGMLENGTIENCYVKGTVNAWEGVGLLAGYNFGGKIRNCYADGEVDGFWFAGGLCGITEGGEIQKCYASTSLLGLYLPGGVVSYNKKGTVVNCFYNSDLAPGIPTQAGVTALTSAQLSSRSQFTNQGWDFIGEEANGTADIWRLCVDGIGYPHLNWEYIRKGDFECPDGVHLEDLARLAEDWLENYPIALYGADANGDKVVNIIDFAILTDRWLEE